MNAKGAGAVQVLLLLQQTCASLTVRHNCLKCQQKQQLAPLQPSMQDTHGQVTVSKQASTK